MTLYTYLYNNDVNSPTYEKDLTRDVGPLRILWEIPGGVQAIEFEYGANAQNAYDFYSDNIGKRIIVLDKFLDRPVAEGWIYGITISPAGCRILCRGPWFRHFDEIDDTAYSLNQTSSAIIKSSLTNHVPVISSDQSHIQETSFTLQADGTWHLSDYGLYPGDLIVKLAAMSNSDLNQWNYWVQSDMMDGVMPQKPLAYFEEQVNDGTFHWQITKADIGGNGITMERSIEDFASAVLVLYRDIAGNEQSLTTWATNTDAANTFWTREIILSGGQMVPDGAEQYRDLTLDKLSSPTLRRAFVISSRRIMDNNGALWPLWYPIKNGGGYLRVNDLYPSAELLDLSLDSKRIGQIMTAEYDGANHTLRVSLDMTDDRADALIAQMGVLNA